MPVVVILVILASIIVYGAFGSVQSTWVTGLLILSLQSKY
jgi:hypothetical protein